MSGIKKIVVRNRLIIIADFTGSDQAGMIALYTQLKNAVLAEGGKQLIATIYTSRNFGTPRFMKHVREESKVMIDHIDKAATVGINNTQKILLKGLSFLFRRNFKAFDTLEQAIQYLVDDTTTDHDIPEYLKDR